MAHEEKESEPTVTSPERELTELDMRAPANPNGTVRVVAYDQVPVISERPEDSIDEYFNRWLRKPVGPLRGDASESSLRSEGATADGGPIAEASRESAAVVSGLVTDRSTLPAVPTALRTDLPLASRLSPMPPFVPRPDPASEPCDSNATDPNWPAAVSTARRRGFPPGGPASWLAAGMGVIIASGVCVFVLGSPAAAPAPAPPVAQSLRAPDSDSAAVVQEAPTTAPAHGDTRATTLPSQGPAPLGAPTSVREHRAERKPSRRPPVAEAPRESSAPTSTGPSLPPAPPREGTLLE